MTLDVVEGIPQRQKKTWLTMEIRSVFRIHSQVDVIQTIRRGGRIDPPDTNLGLHITQSGILPIPESKSVAQVLQLPNGFSVTLGRIDGQGYNYIVLRVRLATLAGPVSCASSVLIPWESFNIRNAGKLLAVT